MVYYLAFILIMSIVAFLFYYADKRRSANGKYRISEKTLLLLSFFGGAFGGYLAMNIFRHKRSKWYFNVVNILSLGLHTAGAILIALFA